MGPIFSIGSRRVLSRSQFGEWEKADISNEIRIFILINGESFEEEKAEPNQLFEQCHVSRVDLQTRERHQLFLVNPLFIKILLYDDAKCPPDYTTAKRWYHSEGFKT